MIILEGPDGTGKSTLAEKLSQVLNLRVQHSGGPPKDPEDIFRRQEAAQQWAILNAPVVLDRIPVISEQIYGPIIRGSNPFLGTMHFERLMDALAHPIIYCRPPMSVIIANLSTSHHRKAHETEEHFQGVMQRWEKIVAAYDRFMTSIEESGARLFRFDYTGQTGITEAELIKELIERGEKR